MSVLKTPLSNLQLELLKAFSQEISEEDLLKLRRFLVNLFAEKAMDAADKVWDEKGWTDEDAEKMTHTRMRTPYRNEE